MKTRADKTQDENQSAAISRKQDGEPSRQFADNRPEAIAQRKVQKMANDSSRVQQLKAAQKRVNPNEAVIQGMFSSKNATITTLSGLNTELALPAYANKTNSKPVVFPFAAAHFGHGQTAAEVDTAVSDSTQALYDYIDVTEVWEAIDAELVTITAPPQGYELIQYGAFSAYMDSAFGLSNQQQHLLINAVNGQGGAIHKSSKTFNMSSDADAYIHDYGANAIFSYQNMGTHRDIPKVKVLQQGNVNSGDHNF